ncbi:MAG: transcription termination factor NusA [Rickettsiales bacterium]|nr:transcription termination factor NusA [Rickettsiales bacterium]
MANTSFSITGGLEIIQVAESVAREKNLKRDIVISALEAAVVSVARKKYGHDLKIKAQISEKDGSIKIFRELDVVENAEDTNTQIELKFAKKKNPDAEIGDTITQELPPIDFGRVAGQTFKQVLMQKIRDAEREREYDEFKDRVGEIASGTIERIENNGDLVINFGRTETILPKNQLIPRENYRKGDRIRAYISDVRRERKGPQIFLSRRSNEFLAALFAQEVPEIYDGIVKISAVARDPGSRAKIAVYSEDSSVDAVGSCIGPRGSRVTSVYNELQGEKIDIIEWSNDLATLAVNAIGSKTKDSIVEVVKIVIDEDNHKIIAVVPDENLSIAIGRRGQNVRLASELIGWNIDIISESDDATRSVEEFNRLTKLFSENLNVEEVIGQLLASEGFTNIEEVAFVEKDELLSIEGFEEELVDELQKRANEYLQNNPKDESSVKTNNQKQSKNNKKGLLGINGVTSEVAGLLIKKGIREVEDLAELDSDELLEITESEGVDRTLANSMIMEARRKLGWFRDEKKKVG